MTIEIKCVRCRDRFETEIETETNDQLCPICKEFDTVVNNRLPKYNREAITPPSRQGILTFNLPEEQNSFEVAVKAMDFALAWKDLHDKIRNMLKYTEPSPDYQMAFEQVQELPS